MGLRADLAGGIRLKQPALAPIREINADTMAGVVPACEEVDRASGRPRGEIQVRQVAQVRGDLDTGEAGRRGANARDILVKHVQRRRRAVALLDRAAAYAGRRRRRIQLQQPRLGDAVRLADLERVAAADRVCRIRRRYWFERPHYLARASTQTQPEPRVTGRSQIFPAAPRVSPRFSTHLGLAKLSLIVNPCRPAGDPAVSMRLNKRITGEKR